MPISQAQIDALNAALASGEQSVSFEGRTVMYRTVGDLLKARDDLQRQLNAQNAPTQPSGRRGCLTRLYQSGRG